MAASVVPDSTKPNLQGCVADDTAPDATVYTDDASDYEGMPVDHQTAKQARSEYVRGDVRPNGTESSI